MRRGGPFRVLVVCVLLGPLVRVALGTALGSAATGRGNHSESDAHSSLLVKWQLKNKTLEIDFNEDARRQLKTSFDSVMSVCVAGPPRAGKSTLINLLANTTRLFAVRPNGPQSEGVRVSHDFFEHADGELLVRFVELESSGRHSPSQSSRILLSTLPACNLILLNAKMDPGSAGQGAGQGAGVPRDVQPLIDAYEELMNDTSNARVLADKFLFPPVVLVLRDWVARADYTEAHFLADIANASDAVSVYNRSRANGTAPTAFQLIDAVFMPHPCDRGCLAKSGGLSPARTTAPFRDALGRLQATMTNVLATSGQGMVENLSGDTQLFVDRVEILCDEVAEASFSARSAVTATRRHDYRRAGELVLNDIGQIELSLPMSLTALANSTDATQTYAVFLYESYTAQWTEHADYARGRGEFIESVDEFFVERWWHENARHVRDEMARYVDEVIESRLAVVAKHAESHFAGARNATALAELKRPVVSMIVEELVERGLERDYLASEDDPDCPGCIPHELVAARLDRVWLGWALEACGGG